MNIFLFINRNFIKIAMQVLLVAIMFISFVSNEFSIDYEPENEEEAMGIIKKHVKQFTYIYEKRRS